MDHHKPRDEAKAREASFLAVGKFHDWFISAFTTPSSLHTALDHLQTELSQRLSFVKSLHLVLFGQHDGPGQELDALTRFGQRLSALDHTLKIRFDLLTPERQGAWFRNPPLSQGGPFAGALLQQPIFAPFTHGDGLEIQAALQRAWELKKAENLPFRSQHGCLWQTILHLNAELANWGRLPPPFQTMHLRQEQPQLPPSLRSPAVQEFLRCIRQEIGLLEVKLQECFERLNTNCKVFWRVFEDNRRGGRTKAKAEDRRSAPHRQAAASGPQGRADSQRYKTPKDLQALRFMGFKDFPSTRELRKRYLSLARQYHPDLPGGEEQTFKELRQCYSHLLERLRTSGTR